MDPVEAAHILAAGIAAGAINTLVGSGTLITFPVLLALGYPPVVANASNTVGLVPGSIAGAWAYRAELATQKDLLVRLGITALLGGITGAVLLLVLPASAFQAVVPVLIIVALVLVVLQPWLARKLKERRSGPPARSTILLTAAIFGTSIYGGYFGAAQGVLLLGFLGLLVPATLQQLNGVKNVFAGLVNAVAAIIFIVAGAVDWPPAGLIALGSIAGSLVAGRYGRRLPDPVLRAVIVVVGSTAVIRMLLQ